MQLYFIQKKPIHPIIFLFNSKEERLYGCLQVQVDPQ
jgi:hypothetical protein